jgi:hypothetical protein
MAKKRIQISAVLKKDLKVVLYLISSWLIGIGAVLLTNDERYIGLVPVSNYIIFRIKEELGKEGYREALRKHE